MIQPGLCSGSVIGIGWPRHHEGSPPERIPHRLKAALDLATRCDSDEFHRVVRLGYKLAEA